MSNPVVKDIELKPLEWSSSRQTRSGARLGHWIAQLLTAALGLAIFCCVIGLAIYTKELSQRFIFGEPPTKAASVPPGNYQWTPDKGLQKIN